MPETRAMEAQTTPSNAPSDASVTKRSFRTPKGAKEIVHEKPGPAYIIGIGGVQVTPSSSPK